MKNILIIILALCIVLFILIPLAYMVLGRVDNPWVFSPTTNYNPAYSKKTTTPSTETDIIKRVFGPSYEKLGTQEKERVVLCTNPQKSQYPHVYDAVLQNKGDTFSVASETYNLLMKFDAPLSDWQYTAGGLQDEMASFTYENMIINLLGRKYITDCHKIAEKTYNAFHTDGSAIAYFASPTYMKQGKALGLTSATLRTSGKDDLGEDFHWYILDETYAGFDNKPVVTIWYTTYVDGVEYWFAFRSYKEYEEDLFKKSRYIIEHADIGI